jgi:hypothetical protein
MPQRSGKISYGQRKAYLFWFAFAASTVPPLESYWFFSGVILFSLKL